VTQLDLPIELRRRAAVPTYGVRRWRSIADSTPFAAVVLAVAVPASLLRLWHINAVGFNSDEAVYSGQGASIAGVAELQPFFPIFRAHPLLHQMMLSLGWLFGGGDRFGRVFSVVCGLATIVVVYKLGALLYGRRAGVLAAVFLAFMPYHVIVSRQVLLDGPETLFATLTLYLLARFALTGRAAWLYATGASLGLTFLAKEVGILFCGAIFAFLALTPSLRVRARDVALSLALMALVIAPYPLSIAFAGKTATGGDFLFYQLFRRPNHGLLFYPTEVAAAIGPALLVVALLGLFVLRAKGSWRETLLMCWIAVPCTFFELWPVKGFQYLLPVAPPIAVLAARTFTHWSSVAMPRISRRGCLVVTSAGVAAVSTSLFTATWARIQPPKSGTFLAGSGGVAGGREAGHWIRDHVPVGTQMLAIGPSMANILQFYGRRKVFGLSVSPNPLRRNPVYEPVDNPDLKIRHNDLQYVVWDSYSATRSPFFGSKILRYADRYNGRVAHVEYVNATLRSGRHVRRPVIVIYAVRP
jgi:hypothetical protein